MSCTRARSLSFAVCVWATRASSSPCFPFFFFKQKTAYEMRISDWSSDVCSSDLSPEYRAARQCARDDGRWAAERDDVGDAVSRAQGHGDLRRRRLHDEQPGNGDRGAPGPRPDRADPERFKLWHDPLETGEYRSEEGSVGKECVSTCGSRGGPE